MDHEHSRILRVRYIATVAALYLLSGIFGWYVLTPFSPLDHSRAVALTRAAQSSYLPTVIERIEYSGRPMRLVIPGSSIDIPVNEGYYDSADNSWTLSGYYAQFAMISTLANNIGGETFIYGHNNDFVLGALRHKTPAPGATALLYTDNGHIFSYSFQSATSLGPSDTAVLNYAGPPILMIQTCTGSLNEWRTEYTFAFSKVIQ